jgi:threonine/homoserine/homoserine lactone efflux protein
MSLEHWLAFAAATTILLIIPGPTVLLIASYALGHGRRAASASVAGVALGDFTSMTGSMLGLGVILAASAMLFTALQWAGACYLVYLGIRLWRAPVADPGAGPAAAPETGSRRIFLHLYAVTALNPKGIVFFVAFLPQFLDTTAPILPQLAIFEATFLTLAAVNASVYALMATAARRTIRRPAVQRAVTRVGGSLLMGAGVAAAAWRRTA